MWGDIMKRSNRLSEIQNMSLSKIMSMSRRELAKAVLTMASAGNKRLVRLQKRNITTPASIYIKEHGGKFSVAGKNVAELREEFQRVKGFLESETSTVRGYRKWESKISQTLRESTGINYDSLTERQKRTFWQAYSKLEELDQANVYGARYRSSINTIYDAVKGGLKQKDVDAFVNNLNEEIYSSSSRGFLSGENDPFNLI